MNERELPGHRGRIALGRALLRGDPIPAEQRDDAREMAGNVARLHPFVWLYLVLSLVFLMQGFGQEYDEARWFVWGTAVLMLAAAVSSAWMVRRMRRALSELDAAGPGS